MQSRMRKTIRTEGVPADSCRSCINCGKLLARNTKMDGTNIFVYGGKGVKLKEM